MAWIRSSTAQPTWILVPKGRLRGPLSPTDCCVALRQTLDASPAVRLAYDGPGASIYEVDPVAAGDAQVSSVETSRSARSIE